jgi:hypothetical protein
MIHRLLFRDQIIEMKFNRSGGARVLIGGLRTTLRAEENGTDKNHSRNRIQLAAGAENGDRLATMSAPVPDEYKNSCAQTLHFLMWLPQAPIRDAK